MFTKLKLEMFVAICWSYSKWCILILSTDLLGDHSVVIVWILALPYKPTTRFEIFFSGLKKVDLYTIIYGKYIIFYD